MSSRDCFSLLRSRAISFPLFPFRIPDYVAFVVEKTIGIASDDELGSFFKESRWCQAAPGREGERMIVGKSNKIH
jgi:hypothetical protein